MNVEAFLLCDAATEQHGKLNVLGTFDTVWSRNTPVVVPQCAVVLRARFLKSEQGEHGIRINIVDDDGQSVVKAVEAKMNIETRETGVASIARNMILNLHAIKFQKFGEHGIDLTIDGKHEASLPFYVNQIPEQSRMQEQ